MADDHELNLVREEEDDQDLLTYNEAGVRVAEEIVAERGRVAELEARRDAGETDLDEKIDRATAFEYAPSIEVLKMALKGITMNQPGIL